MSNIRDSFNEGAGLKKSAIKKPKATPDTPAKKPKKRLPQPIRGIANWLNEEKAATQEDGAKVKKLKKNPKY